MGNLFGEISNSQWPVSDADWKLHASTRSSMKKGPPQSAKPSPTAAIYTQEETCVYMQNVEKRSIIKSYLWQDWNLTINNKEKYLL